jgi:DegV family protein with EDD domain
MGDKAMKIAITLDSTCDISDEVKTEYGFETVPFTVQLGNKSYEDGKIKPTEIFDYVEKTGVLPKTSAINEETFVDFFSKIRKKFDAIIHFDISSDMSSAYQNAVAAAKKVGNVYVVDSATLSTGIALLAIYAKELTKKYNDPKKIVEAVKKEIPKTQASFIIERLDYLYKGGRCSSLAYLGANLLKLRPQIVVQNGKMKAAHKYRGKMEKVVIDYCTDVLRENPNADKKLCFITHSYADRKMVDAACTVAKEAGFEKIYETVAGCTVSSHCGKNTLGILFLNA